MIKLSKIQVMVAEELLKTVANSENIVTYGEIASRVTQRGQNLFWRHVGRHAGQVSKLCNELGLPLLSAKIISKNAHMPGKNFFTLCKILNPNVKGNPEEIYHNELKKIRQCQDWYILAEYLGLTINGLSNDNIKPTFANEISPSEKDLAEGNYTKVFVNKYERNWQARKECLKFYNNSSVCQICGIDIAKTYGAKFTGKIHVHHLIPLSKIKKKYIINPVKDLIPVCPNCHMILHSKGKNEVYTVEEVKNFIKK